MSQRLGQLILMPCPLDFGIEPAGDLCECLPQTVIKRASQLQYWAAENAKTTRAFLKRVDAVTPLAAPLQSLTITELPRPAKGQKTHDKDQAAWDALLAPALDGHDVGLISEAGLPGIADPGARLVASAHAKGIEVVALTGPNSLMLALAASGMNGQSFAFVGYLPIDASARCTRLRELEQLSKRANQTQILIETPYRNNAMLEGMLASLQAQTQISVSSALTTTQAFTRTATVAQWRKQPTPLSDRLPAVFSLLAQ